MGFFSGVKGFFSKVGNIAKKAYTGAKHALNTGVRIGSKVLNSDVFKTIEDISRPILGNLPFANTVYSAVDGARLALGKGEQLQKTIEKAENLGRSVNELRKNPTGEGIRDVFNQSKDVGGEVKQYGRDIKDLFR